MSIVNTSVAMTQWANREITFVSAEIFTIFHKLQSLPPHVQDDLGKNDLKMIEELEYKLKKTITELGKCSKELSILEQTVSKYQS